MGLSPTSKVLPKGDIVEEVLVDGISKGDPVENGETMEKNLLEGKLVPEEALQPQNKSIGGETPETGKKRLAP